MATLTDPALLRLLQLASPALPVGAYAFSQGLEYAVESGWIEDARDTRRWLALQLEQSLARVDLPLLQRQLLAQRTGDGEAVAYWNDYALACRETAELRTTDTATGAALKRLLPELDVPVDSLPPGECSFITAFALAASHWHIDLRPAATAFTWSWLENQVAAATKLIPLGQTQAQQLLGDLLELVPASLDEALSLADDAIGASLPGLAHASCRHETQYTRLFRS